MASEFQCVGVVGRSRHEGLKAVLEELLTAIMEAGAELILEDRFRDLAVGDYEFREREEIGAAADLIIVVGGDGSMLSASVRMPSKRAFMLL